MARYFRLLKHMYDTDDNRTVLRSQRVYVKNSDISVQLSPITPLLIDRVIDTNNKIEKFPENIRRLQTFITNSDNLTGWSELSMNLPYRPNSPLLEEHIKEIIAYDNVICVDYHGEKL